MKYKELKDRTTKELNELLKEKRERLRILRFDLASGKVKNIREIRAIKRDIAKILTKLNQI